MPVAKAAAAKPPERKVNVVLVADVDVMYADFFELRNQAGDPNRGDMSLNPDNVTFVLNVLDSLAGDDRFIEVRKPPPGASHAGDRRDCYGRSPARKPCKPARSTPKSLKRKRSRPRRSLMMRSRRSKMPISTRSRRPSAWRWFGQPLERRLQIKLDRLQKDMDIKTKKIDRELALQVRSVQNRYKMWAVFLPPIFPLLVGVAVFFSRRAGEREGVARSRLR